MENSKQDRDVLDSDVEKDGNSASVSKEEQEQNEENLISLESLLYDGDEEPSSKDVYEMPEETANFDNFFKEYREHISKAFAKDNDVSSAVEKTADTAASEIIHKSTAEKKTQRKQSQKARETEASSAEDFDWDDEITLAPETYEDPDEEDNIFRDVPLEEEEAEESNFSVGIEDYPESKTQLSINFNGDDSSSGITRKSEKKFKYDPEHPRAIDSVYDFIELFILTLVCVMLLTSFAFKHSIVEGSSMENTLRDGESLIISNLFYTPQRGDIIVFEDYSTSLRKAVIKRVIGLPGDTVEVKLNANKIYEVYVNDELIPEEYAYNDITAHPRPTGKWVVEEGEVFVMGDNRYHSSDSREIGTVSCDTILGKVILRFYPFDKFGKVE